MNVIICYAGIGTVVDAYLEKDCNIVAVYEPRIFYHEILKARFEDSIIFDDLQEMLLMVKGHYGILDICYLDVERELISLFGKMFAKLTFDYVLFHGEENSISRNTRVIRNELMAMLDTFYTDSESYILDSEYYQVPQRRKWQYMIASSKPLNRKFEQDRKSLAVAKTKDVLEECLRINTIETFLSEDWMYMLEHYFHPEITLDEVKAVYKQTNLSIPMKLLRRDLWDKPYFNLTIKDLPFIHPLENRRLSKLELCKIQGISTSYENLPEGYIVEATPTKLHEKLIQHIKKI